VKGHDRVAAVGVGYSTTGRRTGIPSWQLGVQAAEAAMADAGLSAAEIDGVTLLCDTAGPPPPGFDEVEPIGLGRMLGITPLNFYGTAGPAYIGPAIQAIGAIGAGLAHTVLSVRIIKQRMSVAAEIERLAAGGETVATGDRAFTEPYGFGVGGVIPALAAMPTRRHMDLFGTTEEQFGAHVIAQRRHASMNDDAIFRDPLTMDDYLASRYIAEPVHLLDCDYPVDSGSAVIYTAGDRARDRAKPPVWVESAAYSAVDYVTFELVDMIQGSPHHAAKMLWARTGLKPDDVDCAQLYDGFTIVVFQWLEALGFCGLGEAGPFVEAGHTRLGGRLPVNTDGGACNVGRRHGANFCVESVRQLRGECGPRQVDGAEVAVWTNATGPYAGAVLMTADRGR
jgi:acetyl-CoA acetyltransferase